jgi:hypothetical protein
MKNLMNEQIEVLKTAHQARPLDETAIDRRVQGLVDELDIQGMKILDIGSLDGYHACNLSSLGAKVTCSDIRPENLHAALFRCLYHNCKDVTYRLLDMETMHEEIKVDEYDIIFHSGCFYHLADPVEHLFNIAGLSKYLLLETHIANPEKYERSSISYSCKDKNYYDFYFGTLYPEGGWNDPQASKTVKNSFWLNKESLLRLFENCKLEIVKLIYDDQPNPHGTRVCYLLERGNE